jgi:hypothetical protein
MKVDASSIHLETLPEPERIVYALLAARLYYYIFVCSQAATILGSPALWGRLIACGRLSIGLASCVQRPAGWLALAVGCHSVVMSLRLTKGDENLRRRLLNPTASNKQRSSIGFRPCPPRAASDSLSCRAPGANSLCWLLSRFVYNRS